MFGRSWVRFLLGTQIFFFVALFRVMLISALFYRINVVKVRDLLIDMVAIMSSLVLNSYYRMLRRQIHSSLPLNIL